MGVGADDLQIMEPTKKLGRKRQKALYIRNLSADLLIHVSIGLTSKC
jgi:hypothetical protein